MLNPNYPLLCTPDAHSDSFPNTDPFDFNSATYFLPMMSLLGVAIASLFIGGFSDRVGRKKVLLLLANVSCVGSIVKYFTRTTFWGFCISNFVFGFFLGNLPIAMAYVGDVYTDRLEKESKLGSIVGCFVMGNSGGGVIAILMENSGLFAPLWIGAALMLLSSLCVSWYLIEPGDMVQLDMGDMEKRHFDEDDEENRPETVDPVPLWNVVLGALADNIGSTGLFPLCLSPLAIEKYLFEFVERDEDPLMSITGYKWLSVMVSPMVVPATLMTPFVFKFLGVAGTCVFGNVFTAVVTAILLVIGNLPANSGTFAAFVFVMYAGFPFTVFSQLTTGPMLDVLAPEDKIGYVQGLNNAAMNFGMALAPWMLGLLADGTSTNVAIITGIGISVGAAAINTPLMWRKGMGRPEPKIPSSRRVLDGEEEALVTKVLDGEYIHPELLFELNHRRALNRHRGLVGRVRSYAEDKESLQELRSHGEEAFRFRRDLIDRVLNAIADPKDEMSEEQICEFLNETASGDPENIQQATGDLGAWIGDYLSENGYQPHMQSVVLKLMVMTAFPSLTQGEAMAPDNVKRALLRVRRVMNKYVEVEEQKKYSASNVMSSAGAQNFYS